MNIEVIDSSENKRTIKFDNKEVTLNRGEADSLWTFSWNTGDPPAKLSGSFTNTSVALEFLKNYAQSLTVTKKKSIPNKEY